MMKTWVLALSCLVNCLAFAEQPTLVQLESQLEQRLLPLVKSFDQQSQVLVKASLKRQKVILPGISVEGLDIVGSGLLHGVGFEDVNSIEVTVLTPKTEIPEWLRRQIEQMISFKNVQGHVIVNTIQDIGKLPVVIDHYDEVANKVKYYGTRMLIATAFAVGLFLLLMLIYVWRAPSAIRSASKNLTKDLKDLSSEGLGKPENAALNVKSTLENARPMETIESAPEESSLEELNPDGVRALLADCYWSEQDEYAHWLWSHWTQEQKAEVIRSLPYAYDYANHFTRLESKPLQYHRHPYYLSPMPIEMVSNEDLGLWLLNQKTQPKLFSPVRQQKIHVPLKNRLDWLESNESSAATSLPKSSEQVRKLPQNMAGSSLSLDDENYILSHHEQIPSELIPELRSWVWLWLQDADFQEQILSEFTAQELADSWLGPAEVLEALMQKMPDRKQILLQDLLPKSTQRRDTWVLDEIARRVVARRKSMAESGLAA